MAIKFDKWHNPKTDKPLARVQTTYWLDRDDLANLLAVNVKPTHEDDLVELTCGVIEAKVRNQLFVNAEARHWWTDDYRELDTGELTADQVREWARGQVAKL